MRIRSTSRQPDVGRESADEGRAGQGRVGKVRGFFITPGPNVRKRKAPSARLKSRLFIPKSRMVISTNPVRVFGIGWGFLGVQL